MEDSDSESELIQSSSSAKQGNFIITENYFHHENSQFPDEAPSSPSESNSEGDSDRPALSDYRVRVVARIWRWWRLSWEALKVKAKLISRFELSAASFSSVLPVAAVAAVLLSLLYFKIHLPWRRTHKQDRLLSLNKHKDEKISELLLQVAQMNEILSARRRVPVLRVK